MKRFVALASCCAGLACAAPAAAVTITEFPAAGDPRAIATGPDGHLWFAEGTGRRIGRIGPSGAGFTQFPAPPDLLTADSFGLTAGPDGNLWFTDAIAGKIGRITRTGAKSCAQLDAKGRFRRVKGRCSPTVFLRSKGTARWSLKLPAALPAGSFAIYARATDTAGRQATRRLSLRLR